MNNLGTRWRRVGPDIFLKARETVRLDLVGMGSGALGRLGEILPTDLLALEARYRFLLNPSRYTSLNLAVIEAMTTGMPVVGLATTEMATAIEDGVSGYVGTDLDRLVDRILELKDDPALAHRLGENARRAALERFHIDRFARDWEETFQLVTGKTLNGQSVAISGANLAVGKTLGRTGPAGPEGGIAWWNN